MRNILVLLFLLLAGRLGATPELDSFTFEGDNIRIDVIYRYENTITRLYYKSLTNYLDEYIDSLKSSGRLSRGKIHLEIMTGKWMDKSLGVEMYRYRDGYYCWLNGLIQPIDHEYLERIIRYFAMDSWESFCYNDSLISPQLALRIFNKRLDTITVKTEKKGQKLFELNNVSLFYQSDSLVCKSTSIDFGQIDYMIPFSNGSRDFIICGETIYVIEKNEVINKITLNHIDFTGGFYEQPWAEVYPKWVNFRNMDGYFLSYSMAENRFFKL